MRFAPATHTLQIVDLGPSGPMRCQSCKAYVNPYMRWVEGGRSMQCAFCGALTEVPPDYQCHTGPDGERRDKMERPELCKGCGRVGVVVGGIALELPALVC